MPEILRGNFSLQKPPKVEDVKPDLTSRFEQEALKRLGGSIAFVSKKKFLYGVDPGPGKPEGASC